MHFISSFNFLIWFINLNVSLSDLLGGLTYTFKPSGNSKLIFSLATFRLVPLLFIFLAAFKVPFFQIDLVKILNIGVFMSIHGYCNSSLFGLAYSERIQHFEMQLVGKIMAFMLIMGIVLGSFVAAFGLSNINF